MKSLYHSGLHWLTYALAQDAGCGMFCGVWSCTCSLYGKMTWLKHRVVHSLNVVHGDLTGVCTLISINYSHPISMLIDSLFTVKYSPWWWGQGTSCGLQPLKYCCWSLWPFLHHIICWWVALFLRYLTHTPNILHLISVDYPRTIYSRLSTNGNMFWYLLICQIDDFEKLSIRLCSVSLLIPGSIEYRVGQCSAKVRGRIETH